MFSQCAWGLGGEESVEQIEQRSVGQHVVWLETVALQDGKVMVGGQRFGFRHQPRLANARLARQEKGRSVTRCACRSAV